MVKIVDVAELAQVSVATVSRALNNNDRVDPVLAERVRQAAETLGYRPNGVARNLRRQGTQVWALIIARIENPFYTAVAHGVEDVAHESGFSVLLCNSDEDEDRERRYLEVAAQERVAGVILTPRTSGLDVSSLLSNRIPMVAIDRFLDQPVDLVTATSLKGAVAATEHLFDQGWRRPALLTRPANTATTEQRRLGYRRVMRKRGLRENVVYVPFDCDDVSPYVDRLLDVAEPPDALFTVDSMLALGVLATLHRRKLTVGRDLGVISFDDSAWAPVIQPPLSVVAQPAYEIGAEAARLLVQRIRSGAPAKPRKIQLNTELIIRDSTRRH